jgi:hypothetical protein
MGEYSGLTGSFHLITTGTRASRFSSKSSSSLAGIPGGGPLLDYTAQIAALR